LRMAKGYACLERTWRGGDVVAVDFPMPVQRVRAHPKVLADSGRVALQRGPIVYCLEEADNSEGPQHFALPPESKVTAQFRPQLLSGVTVLQGDALLSAKTASHRQPVKFTAVPYYSWDNRAPGSMSVWLPEDAAADGSE
jgi:uncharacterized protein